MGNKIKTDIFNLDKIMEGGIPVGKITMLLGESKPMIYNIKDKDAISQSGKCLIDEMIKKMKEEGVDTSSIKSGITKMEKIGDNWFPVSYYENGIVLIDYPSRFLNGK